MSQLTPRDSETELAARLAEIAARLEAGETLSATESEALSAADDANAAEAAARDAFAAYYASASSAAQTVLPPSVADAMSRWVEAGKRWETAKAALLALPKRPPVRSGPRLRVRPPESIRLPTSPLAREALAALFSPKRWKSDATGEALIAQGAAARMELDDALGFGAERAIEQITRHGPSTAQTLLALAALWQERNAGESPETYVTLYASDLLRFQGKKETPRGGYHRDDLLAKGRDLYLLSRISLPQTFQSQGESKVALGRILSLESLESVTVENGERSIVRFRYHLGHQVHAWLAEGAPSARLSARLLRYHPIRQKHAILLGFCLACADGAAEGGGARRIALTSLLRLAGMEVPERRVTAFLTSIEDALQELARDEVIPAVRLIKPPGWTDLLAQRRTREVIERSVVEFPALVAGSYSSDSRSA